MSNVQLSEILGQAKTVRAGDDIYPILSMTMQNGLIPQQDKFKKSVASKDLSDYKVVARGQLVVGFPIDEGVLAFQECAEKAIVSPAYGIWDVVEPEAVHSSYLEKYLRSPRALSYYRAKLRGSTARRRSLPTPEFKAMPLPLPTMDEQRRIADILDKADSFRVKRRESIAHLEAFGQSIFHEMFGGSETEPRTTLSDVLRSGLRNGLSPSTSGAVAGEVLTLSAITRSELDLSQKKVGLFDSVFHPEQLVRPGQILICRGNGNKELVGKGKVIHSTHGRVGYPDTIIAGDINASVIEPMFLQSAWESRDVRGQIERGARTTNGTFKVNQGLLGSVSFPLPPMDLQQAFAGRIAAVERLKASYRAQLVEFDNLFLSLQDRAFKGEL